MNLLQRIRRRRAFNRTLRELEFKSNRELNDMGIARWRVRDVAAGRRPDPREVV